MLRFYQGNRIEILAEELIVQLSQQPPDDPLSPEILVVQNYGMARWLSLFMAEREGVAANLKFNFPSEQIWDLIRVMNPNVPESLPSDKEPLTWSLMQILQEAIDHPDLSSLKRYIKAETREQQQYRMWKLCGRIADVFDQYLIYRPDLLMDWQQGKRQTEDPSERWQRLLWNRLVQSWNEQDDERVAPHRTELQRMLMEAIDNGRLDDEKLPDRISIFGVSTMPPVFIRILTKLSKLIDVNWFWFSPGIKKEPGQEHPLITSFGREGREFIEIVSEVVEKDSVVKSGFSQTDLSEEYPSNTLLGNLQNSILLNSVSLDANVNSSSCNLQLHSCHSRVREVEVLYDQLLCMFDEYPDLNPEDVVIMVPDIDTYAPVVDAVFGSVEKMMPEIPYSIADRSIGTEHHTVRTFLKLLELIESRFKLTDVLDLLDSKALRIAFDLSDNDITRVENWIRENHIRWGIDGSFKKSEDLPESDSFTWKAGLSRLMLGYSARADEEELFNGIYPYGDIEGREDARLLGRFSRLMNTLFTFYRKSISPKTLPGWSSFLKNLLKSFIPGQQEFYQDLLQILNQIENLENEAKISGFSQKIPFRIIRSALKSRLEKDSSNVGFLGSGVTFCAFVPMRSIPFKVIGMLGMNDDAFPRTTISAEFDLVAKYERPGDRSRKNDDRYLFLENLVSAKKHLYISYLGQSNREDTQFPPSVVVRELLDHLQEYLGIKKDKLIKEHRLQAFSPEYFKKTSSLYSYNDTQRSVAEQIVREASKERVFLDDALPSPDESYKSVPVEDLIRFFSHPARYMLRNRLGIYLEEERILDEDREPFELYGLTGYELGQKLLNRLMDGKEPETYRAVAEAQDLIPEGWPGDRAFNDKVREVKEFQSRIRHLLEEPGIDDISFDIQVGDFKLYGHLAGLSDRVQLRYRFGRMRPKDLIDLWIRHLVLQELEGEHLPVKSLLLTRDKDEVVGRYELSPVANHLEILQQLLDRYWEGLQKRIWFFPESSYAYAHERIYKGNNHEKGIRAAQNRWKNEYVQYQREGEDPYNELLYETDKALSSNGFIKISEQFWRPFFEVYNQEEIE